MRIRTIQVLIVLSTAPIWTLCEAAKHGFVAPVLLVWGALVATPLLMMRLALAGVKREAVREQIIALVGATAIVGYSAAIPISMIVIAILSFRGIT